MSPTFEEQIIREKAIFFAKGKFPDIIRHSIPDSGFSTNKTYMVSIIEVDEEEKSYESDIKTAKQTDEIPF